MTLHVCAERPTDLVVQGSLIALSGLSQTLTIYGDASLSGALVTDDQGTSYPVDPTGLPHVRWSPTSFFSRLDFSRGTSKSSLFGFSLAGLRAQIVRVDGASSATGAFTSATLQFALPAEGLGSIQIQPSLTGLILKNTVPIIHSPSSTTPVGGFLGFALSKLLASSVNLNGATISVPAQIQLPPEFGGDATRTVSATFAIGPHDFTVALPTATTPHLFEFAAAFVSPRIQIDGGALTLRADQATLALPKGLDGTLVASAPSLQLTADSTSPSGRRLVPSATSIDATGARLSFGSIASLESISVHTDSFSTTNPYLKFSGQIHFSDLVDSGLTAAVDDLELNGTSIKAANVNLLRGADLGKVAHVLGFSATVSQLGLSYASDTGAEFVVSGKLSTPPWLGSASLNASALRYRVNPPGLDRVDSLVPNGPLKIASLAVTLTGDTTHKCGTTGLAISREAISGTEVWMCGQVSWPHSLIRADPSGQPLSFSDLGFGPTGAKVGSLEYTNPVAISFFKYLDLTTSDISLEVPADGSTSSLHIKGDGKFSIPGISGRLLKASSFTFDTRVADDYDLKIANSGQVLSAEWGNFNVQADNVVLEFSRDGAGQKQDATFDLMATYGGLGVKGDKVGFTIDEQPPGPKVSVTQHGRFRPYLDYVRAAGFVFGFLLGVLIGHH